MINRRNSIKLMLAACIGPAYIANGLMRIKPIVVVPDVFMWPPLTNQSISGSNVLVGNEEAFYPDLIRYDTAFIHRLKHDPLIQRINPFMPRRLENG